MKHPKTTEARHAEADALRRQVRDLGLPEETIQPVMNILDDFATTGQGATTRVKIQGTPLVLDVRLSAQAHITSYIRVTRA